MQYIIYIYTLCIFMYIVQTKNYDWIWNQVNIAVAAIVWIEDYQYPKNNWRRSETKVLGARATIFSFQYWNVWAKTLGKTGDRKLVGGFNPSEKYQLGLLFPIYEKIKHVPNHLPKNDKNTWEIGVWINPHVPSTSLNPSTSSNTPGSLTAHTHHIYVCIYIHTYTHSLYTKMQINAYTLQ